MEILDLKKNYCAGNQTQGLANAKRTLYRELQPQPLDFFLRQHLTMLPKLT
jgi:hypothetical protein